MSSLDAVMLRISPEKGSVIVKTASKMKEVMGDADRRKSRLLEDSQDLCSIFTNLKDSLSTWYL